MTSLRCVLPLLLLISLPALAADPLPSWSEGANKQHIIEFVQAVTTEGSMDYVKPAERIAVFDNDGTLWTEQPAYFEVLFAFDEIKRLAPGIPSGKPPSHSRPCSTTITRPWPKAAWKAC